MHNKVAWTHLKASKVNLSRRSNDIRLVNPPDGDTVDLERSSNKEESASELLEEDNALAAEAAGEEDEDGAGGDGRAELGGLDGLAGELGGTDVLGGVEGGGGGRGESAGGTVGLAADGLGRRRRGGSCRGEWVSLELGGGEGEWGRRDEPAAAAAGVCLRL